MRILYLGLNGDDVKSWETFLTGQGFYRGAIDGDFESETRQATIDFQRANGLNPDGVAGNETLGRAMQLGYPGAEDVTPAPDFSSPAWPAPPDFPPLVNDRDRQNVFGTFTYVPAPTVNNPEGLQITNDWAQKNIVEVVVPQLKGVQYGPSKFAWHRLATAQLQALWQAWEDAGLLPLILMWGGSWNARFVRGSKTYLSNHAFGTAFDINVPWNLLGAQPALVGEKGSTRKLVEIANANGFFWGGHFKGRPDGMHFEVAVLRTPAAPAA